MQRSPIRSAILQSRTWVIALLCAGTALADSEHNPVAREPRAAMATRTLPVIVKLKSDGSGAAIAKLSNGGARATELSKRTGLTLAFKREISERLLASSIELGDREPAVVLKRL